MRILKLNFQFLTNQKFKNDTETSFKISADPAEKGVPLKAKICHKLQIIPAQEHNPTEFLKESFSKAFFPLSAYERSLISVAYQKHERLVEKGYLCQSEKWENSFQRVPYAVIFLKILEKCG